MTPTGSEYTGNPSHTPHQDDRGGAPGGAHAEHILPDATSWAKVPDDVKTQILALLKPKE